MSTADMKIYNMLMDVLAQIGKNVLIELHGRDPSRHLIVDNGGTFLKFRREQNTQTVGLSIRDNDFDIRLNGTSKGHTIEILCATIPNIADAVEQLLGIKA